MKRPILYRVVFYSIFAGLCSSILFLLSVMQYAPFTSENMRSAYYNGCNIGLHAPLTTGAIKRCEEIADRYKWSLDDMDRQLDGN